MMTSPASQCQMPSIIFGTPRCFCPNKSRMTLSKKKAKPAASSIVLSSRTLFLSTERNKNFSTAAPTASKVRAEASNPKAKGIPHSP